MTELSRDQLDALDAIEGRLAERALKYWFMHGYPLPLWKAMPTIVKLMHVNGLDALDVETRLFDGTRAVLMPRTQGGRGKARYIFPLPLELVNLDEDEALEIVFNLNNRQNKNARYANAERMRLKRYREAKDE